MANTKTKTKTTTTAKAPEPVAVAPNLTDGGSIDAKVHTIKVHQEGSDPVEYRHHELRAREVVIGGRPYDHADTDADGVWIYRNDRQN